MLLKNGRGTRCTPFPNLFETNTLHTTICTVLKWSRSISGVELMPLAPVRMCQKNVLDVQNSLQAVPQLQHIKIAVVVQGAGDGKQVLGWLRPQLAYVQGCRWVADLHNLYSDEESLKSDLPPQIQNQKWLPHTCLLGGPQVGGNATSPLHSRGSPKQRGTKSEVGTTRLPSGEPKNGHKCYVTLAFWGGP